MLIFYIIINFYNKENRFPKPYQIYIIYNHIYLNIFKKLHFTKIIIISLYQEIIFYKYIFNSNMYLFIIDIYCLSKKEISFLNYINYTCNN